MPAHFSYRRTFSVARKEVLHLLRDPGTLFFALFIPVLELFMLGYAIDTNVRRVVARHRLGLEPPGGAAVRRAAEAWIDRANPGAWNAALMDLGREVCRPEPLCAGCPLRRGCRFRAMPGDARRPGRRPERFAGSMRELRGRIVDAVREAPSVTVAEVAARWGEPHARVAEAVAALAGEGLVRAGPGGRITLGA